MIATHVAAVVVRPARNEDGPTIGSLAWQCGITLELDWSRVAPYWMIAERDGVRIGAIQLCPSLPIGRIEMLCVDQFLPYKTKAITVKLLLLSAMSIMKNIGAQYVCGVIEERRTEFIKIIKKRGAFKTTDGGVYLVPLT